MTFDMINANANNINMDNTNDSENNAKVSDSAYSNSCSNSQARSRSSHSTHSGSHSSGSSGYGGKPSTSGYSSNNVTQLPDARCKTKKKKKPAEFENATIVEEQQTNPEPEAQPTEEQCIDDTSSLGAQQTELLQAESANLSPKERSNIEDKDGFSCVISMQDGVVMYTTDSITSTFGFPRDMWIGRSFIDFVHPRDRSTFASQITNCVAIPKDANGTHKKGNNTLSTMVCRIRRYRGLSNGFGVRDRTVSFMPFLLKLSFRNISDEDGDVIYLLMQITPLFSAFKVPNEIVPKPVPFIIRHAANGDIKYIDPESVPYLGYSPQDIINKDAIHLYHPHDLSYLRQVYETIAKEGSVPRSKPYRMLAQNGDYVKLETEWSSFINPWSRKLEFVIGKHLIIEGPSNPDVFQTADKTATSKFSEDDRNKAQSLRESIVRVMNEIFSKPAEAEEKQMTKRCQDLASFMESLMEEAPKTDDDVWLGVKEPDSAYYDFSVQEHDSVMLGGISPHHDSYDSKSSTETQMSYNQLNYKETLQRYFDSHLPYSEYGNPESADNQSASQSNSVGHLSPRGPSDFADLTSSCDSSGATLTSPITLGNYSAVRLTESALIKHNAVMEKELMKLHRESKLGNKDERKKESRLNKKAHLARCNASFLPTSAGLSTVMSEPNSLKRTSRHSGYNSVKQRSPTAKLPRRNENKDEAQPSTSTDNAVVSAPVIPAVNNMNAFFLGIPQQMSLMSPAAVPGMLPFCYVPATPQPINALNKENQNFYQAYPMPCVMYGQPIYTSPIMYTPVNTQMQQMQQMQQLQQMQQMQQMQQLQQMHQMQQIQQIQQTQQGLIAQNSNTSVHPRGLSGTSYQEACKLTVPAKTKAIPPSVWQEKGLFTEPHKKGSGESHSSATVSQLSTKSTNESKRKTRQTTSEEAIDKTDEESSYSSFYSNFFKSESGSAEESEAKKRSGAPCYFNKKDSPKVPRRKMEPPWMEQVCVTSELIYQYQVLPKSLEEVLLRDQEQLKNLQQPSLVNDQLGQLYLDLQLEGVATRLTLEEGVTSSSSSGDENFVRSTKAQVRRRKREYSKLVMIYEEDAPFPPPEEAASSSTS